MIWQLDRFIALAMSDTTGIGIERDASSRAKAGSFAPAKTRRAGHGVEVTFSIRSAAGGNNAMRTGCPSLILIKYTDAPC